MDIKEDEIKEIKKIGHLNGAEVSLVTLKGGFHIGMGRKDKNASKNDILAVGSHPALINHQISKKFNDKFEQTMAKNEAGQQAQVLEYSHVLNKQQNTTGLDIYAIKKNESVEFKITKHNFNVFSIQATEIAGEIVLEKTEKDAEKLSQMDIKDLSEKLGQSIKEYAKKNNLKIKKKF